MPGPPDPVQILAVLEGLPLWGVGRAVDMAMFQFGARRRRISRGFEGEHGDHALHVQCAWRLVRDDRTLVGSRDDVDPESGAPGQRDRLIGEALDPPLVVEAVQPSTSGFLVMAFVGGTRLEVLPDSHEAADDEAEQWRFFAPGSGEPHLVCLSTGLYLD